MRLPGFREVAEVAVGEIDVERGVEVSGEAKKRGWCWELGAQS